ncbi:unnamed protein product [Thelazia callipaeda]|uniref:Kaptin n=1 Tax=Thelazia callipaeda TaxID=103827 RepID=A0A0N5CL94_THECL|nr:unnamed protein product [Thelazia callipaeda]
MAQSGDFCRCISESNRNVNVEALFASHLSAPSSSILMEWSQTRLQFFVIIGKYSGDLLVFTINQQYTKLENIFNNPVTSVCCGKLRQNSDEIVAISATGQIRSFDFPHIDPESDELQKPLPLFEQLIQANICASYIGDLDGDGLYELLVSMTDRCVRTYRYVANHLAPLSKYEVPSHICGLAIGITNSGQFCAFLTERRKNYVVKIFFGSNSCNILPQMTVSESSIQELIVPDRPVFLDLIGSLASRLRLISAGLLVQFFVIVFYQSFYIGVVEDDSSVTLVNPGGDFICAATVNLPNEMFIAMILDIYGNLLIYGWKENEIPPTQPIAKAIVLPDADRIAALPSGDEHEILLCVCTVYFKVVVYLIDLSSLLKDIT